MGLTGSDAGADEERDAVAEARELVLVDRVAQHHGARHQLQHRVRQEHRRAPGKGAQLGRAPGAHHDGEAQRADLRVQLQRGGPLHAARRPSRQPLSAHCKVMPPAEGCGIIRVADFHYQLRLLSTTSTTQHKAEHTGHTCSSVLLCVQMQNKPSMLADLKDMF